MMTTNPKAYALLIGVGDYSAFDPTGAANLEGPTNDVAGWLHIVRDLGVPVGNIRICRAPPPGASALDVDAGITLTGAARADLVAGLDWLAATLDGHSGVKAVLSWSGHGTRTAAGEVLCPSDVAAEGATLKNGLPVAEVAARLARRAKGTRITALMDVCHDATGFDGSGRTRVRALRWHGAAAKPTAAHTASHAALGDRVLSSSRTGTPSFDIPLIEGVRGAFSWAASNLIHRHGLVEGDAGATAGITFARLAEHGGQILEGMRVAQRPTFHGGGRAAQERVFSAWGDRLGDAGAQSLTPEEIWPGVPDGEVLGGVVRYELTADDAHSTLLGNLFITSGKASGAWTASVQYWPFTFDTWPSGSFTATYKGDDSVPSSPPTGGSIYSNAAVGSGTGKTVTWDGTIQPLYAVTDLTTSATAFFKIKATNHGLKVACTAATGGYVAASYADTVQFVPKPSAHVTKTYAVLDTPLIS